jgi:hypothetical protein
MSFYAAGCILLFQVLDGTNATRAQRENVHDYCTTVGCKLLFIERMCDDEDILSRNIKVSLSRSDPIYHELIIHLIVLP